MWTTDDRLLIAFAGKNPITICGKMANRHGLIAGATGTGKTVSLQVLAETFSQAGVPCFMADMKGDLSGVSQSGRMTDFIAARCEEFDLSTPEFGACPVRFFDVFGKQGHPLRTTISEMGPILLARLLELNETQTGILNIVFRVADDRNLLLLDMKDLREMLSYVAENAKEFSTDYGNIAPQSVGAIQRALLALENEGADQFFGEPAFNVEDFIKTENGQGVLNILAADKLSLSPRFYSTFLLWLLSELYANLPEVGDLPLPKLVFFFDEAHLLFDDAPKGLLDKMEQVVRLIRSKGVGIYFITQKPSDIPDDILAQLGNRIQHALRAFTPKEMKAVRAAAESFRPNPAFKTADEIQNLKVGEALISVLDESGTPTVVEKGRVLFPLSSIGTISPETRAKIIDASPLKGVYDQTIDRVSAYEIISGKAAEDERRLAEEKERKEREEAEKKAASVKPKRGGGMVPASVDSASSYPSGKTGHHGKTPGEKLAGSAATAMGRSLGRSFGESIIRGLLGTIFKGK